MKKNLFLAGSAFALLVCLACEGAEGIVNAAWLNARVFPELKSPVAVKLPRNKKVEVTKRHGLWLEIAAPDTTPVFASAAFLDENKVLRDINLRIRPAAGAAVIGRVRKGDTLKAVSTPDRFGWVQVAPLPEMRLYVYKDYVTYDPAKVPVAKMTPAREEKKTEQAPAKTADAKAAPAPVKPAPAPAKAAPAPAQEKTVPAKAAPASEKPAPAPAPKKESSTQGAKASEFLEKFKKRHGSYICREILGCDISTDEGKNHARSNGLYGKYCPEMVRTAAEILTEMLGGDE